MAGINKAILVGHLGKDPEIRYSQAGLAICNFTLATSESYTPKDGGAREEKTEWHKIKAFGRLAEVCGEYLHKGKQVYIEGRIQTNEWQDKEGNKRWTTEIIANTMQMLGSASGGQGQSRGQGQGQESNREGQQNNYSSNSDGGDRGGGNDGFNDPPAGDDEIPF